jgi:hypothetical protein
VNSSVVVAGLGRELLDSVLDFFHCDWWFGGSGGVLQVLSDWKIW